jgi:hypothetical protein
MKNRARQEKITPHTERASTPKPAIWRLLLAGFGCLTVMVLTHSPGHYLDLLSAIAGVALLLAAGVLRLLRSN